jgi:DNA-nicking Smr family endonuclease
MNADDPVAIPIEAHLDLHAFAPRDIADVVDSYVVAAWEAGLREIRLIHGRGIGVQRATVHHVLARHPRVDSFRDAPDAHLGATIAVLVPSGDSTTTPPPANGERDL